MTNNVLLVLPLLSLWIALVALASLVVRELGWARLKPYSLTLLILAASLMALPCAAVIQVTRPYHARILAVLLRRHSAAIAPAGGCSVFPANNVWNTGVRHLPVDGHSKPYIRTMGPDVWLRVG